MSAIQKKSRFKELDKIVKKSFAEAAIALREIRDEKLYLDGGFDSFKEYCKHIGTTYLKGYRLIEAGKISEVIPEVTNVSVGMAISKIPPRKRQEVVAEALKQNEGKLTAKAVENAAKVIPARKPPVVRPVTKLKNEEKDKSGILIPSEVLPLWNRRDELQHLITSLHRIAKTIEEAQGSADLLFRMSDQQGCISKLRSVVSELKAAMPEYVCPKCNGVMAMDCDGKFCQERGLISTFWYGLAPEETRKLRG